MNLTSAIVIITGIGMSLLAGPVTTLAQEAEVVCGISVSTRGCWSEEYRFRFEPNPEASLLPTQFHDYVPFPSSAELGSQVLTDGCGATFVFDGDIPEYSIMVTAEHIKSPYDSQEAAKEYVRLQGEANARADAAGRESFGDERWQQTVDMTKDKVLYKDLWGTRVRIDVSTIGTSITATYSCAREGILLVVCFVCSTKDYDLLTRVVENGMQLL